MDCQALQLGTFSLLDNGKTMEISDQENKQFPNNEIAVLGRWITAEWAGRLEAQTPARRLFGKVGFRAARKGKNL